MKIPGYKRPSARRPKSTHAQVMAKIGGNKDVYDNPKFPVSSPRVRVYTKRGK